MSSHETARVEIKKPTDNARKQFALASELAELFVQSPEGTEPPTQVAVALANPAIYFNREREKLPLSFQDKWKKLSEDYEIRAKTIAKEGQAWHTGVSGFESMHNLIATGGVKPNFRLAVLFSILESSELYEESTVHIPDEAAIYEENILEMEALLPDRSL